jgi:tight adherence protein C
MQPDLIFTLAAVFGTVAMFTGAVTSMMLARGAPERRRLREMTAPRPVALPQTLQLADAPSQRVVRWAMALPGSGNGAPALQKRLAAAGYFSPAAAVLFATAQLLLPVAFAVPPLIVFGIPGGLVGAFASAVFGYLIPDLYVSHRIAEQRKALQDGLPDALDLIVICMEAGSSLDQAILKASAELELALPEIARELKTVAMETRAGKPRLQCFQDLAARVDVDEVRALVAMLIQTDRFGTSIAQSLRTHSETARTNRRLRAEERAGKVGVKLVFPLVLCLMPSLYVVCLGPVIVNLSRTFL